MKVKVFHANNPTFGLGDVQPKFPSEFTHVADIIIDIHNAYINTSITLARSLAFQFTNHIDADWRENIGVTALTDNPRSSAVGDVIQIGDRYWKVDMCGFKEIEVPD